MAGVQETPSPPVELEPEVKRQKVDTFLWTAAMITQLISIWGAEYVRLGRDNMQQKHSEAIAQELNEDAVVKAEQCNPITVKQCQTKMNTLKKTFKDELKSKNGTGGVNSSWPYFELLAPYLATTPKMTGIPNGRDGSRQVNVQDDQTGGGASSSDEKDIIVDNQEVEFTGPNAKKKDPVGGVSSSSEVKPAREFCSEGIKGQKTKQALRRSIQKSNQEEAGTAISKSLDAFTTVYAQMAQQALELQNNLAKEKLELQIKLAESNAEMQRKIANDRVENDMKILEMRLRLEAEFANKKNSAGNILHLHTYVKHLVT